MADLESDSATQNIIETLVELAKHALDIIVWKLSQELESLAKVRIDHSTRVFPLHLGINLRIHDFSSWCL